MSKTTASKGAIAPERYRNKREATPQYASEVLSNGVVRTGVLVQADQPWADAQLAALYDAFVFADDLPLYLDLAQTQGTRVLEVACGSGRVVLPLVSAGFDVVGIDVSPHMLALARAKLDALSGAHGNAQLV